MLLETNAYIKVGDEFMPVARITVEIETTRPGVFARYGRNCVRIAGLPSVVHDAIVKYKQEQTTSGGDSATEGSE